jgi:hypothetical protein
MPTVVDFFLCAFIVTWSTPTHIYHHQRRTRARCLLISRKITVLQLQSCYHTWISLQVTDHAVLAFFVPLGCIRRRQMRESPMSLPRFSGEDLFELSSVMHPQDVQLNPQPQRRLSTRLLVEPLALRLIRLQEALGEDSCRFFPSEFSSDPLTGSNCFLRHRQYVLPVAPLSCVLLGTSLISVFRVRVVSTLL